MNAIDAQHATDSAAADMGAVKPDPEDEDLTGQVTAHAELDDPQSAAPPSPAEPAVPRRQRHPWRGLGGRVVPRRLTFAAGLVAYLALLALAFYAGMSHQSSADHQLYDQYHPQATGSARGGGTGGAANSLVAAALSVGDPPGSGPSSSAAPAPQPNAPASGGQGAAPTSSTLTGQLTGISTKALSVQPGQGSGQTLALASSTRFYLVNTAPTSTLAPGQRVVASVSRDSSGASTATGITISPAGAILVDAQSANQAQDPGTPIAGAITAVDKGSLTMQTSQGTTLHLRLGGTTPVYGVVQATSGRVKAGMSVAVQATTVNAQAVAADVVASGIPGITLLLSAPR
jgi:hypothetical protein